MEAPRAMSASSSSVGLRQAESRSCEARIAAVFSLGMTISLSRISSRNPLEILDREMVMPSENTAAILASHERLSACLNPTDELEALIARGASMAALQLHRTWDL